MSKIAPKLKLVKIEWYDHCDPGEGVWMSRKYLQDANSAPVFITVGYIVAKNKRSLIVASTIPAGDEAWNYGSPSLIVRAAIKKITKL